MSPDLLARMEALLTAPKGWTSVKIELSPRELDEAIAALRDREKTVRGWISVEDRLPELEQRVLILDGGDVAFATRIHKRNDGRVFWDAENYGYDGTSDEAIGVTHWQPLPELPILARFGLEEEKG